MRKSLLRGLIMPYLQQYGLTVKKKGKPLWFTAGSHGEIPEEKLPIHWASNHYRRNVVDRESEIENEECETCGGTCFEWAKGDDGDLTPLPCEDCYGAGLSQD